MAGPYQGSDLNPSLNNSSEGTDPREYNQHQRYSNLARRRHSQQLAAFLSAQATRLSSSTSTIFAKLKKYTAAKIAQATNISQLP